MAVTKSPGTENLRADPHVYRGAMTESPSKSGKDVGGTSNLGAKTQTFVGRTKEANPRQRSIDIPPGVQTFDDDTV